MSTQREWVDWLAEIGYGIDFNNDTDPPCTIAELAEAYQRQEAAKYGKADEIADYEWCIRENTGAFAHTHPERLRSLAHQEESA